MAVVVLQYRVPDVDQWKAVFDERHNVRQESGATRHWIHRSLDDPHQFAVSIEFPSADQARAFAADPRLRDALSRAGVEGSATVLVAEQFESITY